VACGADEYDAVVCVGLSVTTSARRFLASGSLQFMADSSQHADNEASAIVRHCDEKLSRWRALIDSGAASETVARWINETESERSAAAARLRKQTRVGRSGCTRPSASA
jgi:biopolymer transport protein ExbB/TolQ